MKALRIYTPEGSASFTRRVSASNIETHIAANDQHADEARVLREFIAAAEIPASLADGTMIKDSEGTDEHGDYVRYVEGPLARISEEEALERIDGEIVGDSVIHYDCGTQRWYRCDRSDLTALRELMGSSDEDEAADAYSHWCSGTTSDEYRREEEARAAAVGELLTYHVETDAGSDSEEAPTLEAAYEQARAKITDAEIEDGATLWVESPAGDRITMDSDGTIA